jgi:hypothetical protein
MITLPLIVALTATAVPGGRLRTDEEEGNSKQNS